MTHNRLFWEVSHLNHLNRSLFLIVDYDSHRSIHILTDKPSGGLSFQRSGQSSISLRTTATSLNQAAIRQCCNAIGHIVVTIVMCHCDDRVSQAVCRMAAIKQFQLKLS